MANNLLKSYVKLILREFSKPARVPTQLIEPDQKDENEVAEMSTTANIQGYTLPLGMKPKNQKKNKNINRPYTEKA